VTSIPGLFSHPHLCVLHHRHWAAGKNALPCVRALIKSGAEVDATDWAGRTPLHWAVLVDAVESASELLAADADPLLADRDQRSALHWAADRASEGCLDRLLHTKLFSAETIDAADWGGYSALHYAARRASIGCVKKLLRHGASRRIMAMNGNLPADLTTCAHTKALLQEVVGMKRQRSLSSNNLVLFSVLPELAMKFYEAWKVGDVSDLVSGGLRTPSHPKGRVLCELMKRHAKVDIIDLHVCTNTSKVVVELSSSTGGDGAHAACMHALTFNEDGLVASFTPYCLQPDLASSSTSR
jgi:hypothetical protein